MKTLADIKIGEGSEVKVRVPSNETLLTPRFYTTDFDEMAQLNVTSNKEEILASVESLNYDVNKKHFLRDEEFNGFTNDNETTELMLEFLERSCIAEFSGFLLYKQLSNKLAKKQPILAKGFSLMARDEARHAGFLNKAMSDFGATLDLGKLTKVRKYTKFSPANIFFATYLSEKIGYWRYITIFNHLAENDLFRVYPIFRYFESWCQDENRHSDFFAAVLRSQKSLVNGSIANLRSYFFLFAVFATMWINDQSRSDFYEKIGLDAKSFDRFVIEKTNEASRGVFPVVLNMEYFFNFMSLFNK